MTAINSNRAIRGPVTAVPVVAGKGVRLVADTENNRIVAEADETVLWASAAGEAIAVNKEFNLSEAYTNFSKIMVSAVRAPASGNAPIEQTFEVSATLNVICFLGRLLHASNNEVYFDTFRATLSGSKMTINTFVRKTLQTSGLITEGTNFPVTVFKIVGINRVASN